MTGDSRPAPLASMPTEVRRGVRGVLTDIDDTLTTGGVLGAVARDALERLARRTVPVVAITGRPAGLCAALIADWPIAAIVGENGGVWMRRNPRSGAIEEHYEVSAEERARQRGRLRAIGDRILAAVPRARLARDYHRRETDLALDWAENVAPLPERDVARIVSMLREAGLSTAVSSIHVHGWFGAHDKLSATRALFAQAFGVDLDAERECYVYVGDAPNDAPMFAYFPNSIGVANVRTFLDRLPTPPAFVTASDNGAGFAEVVDALLAV